MKLTVIYRAFSCVTRGAGGLNNSIPGVRLRGAPVRQVGFYCHIAQGAEAQGGDATCPGPRPTLLKNPYISPPPTRYSPGLHCVKGRLETEVPLYVCPRVSLCLTLLSLFWPCFITKCPFNITSLFLQSGNKVSITTTPFENTSIKTGPARRNSYKSRMVRRSKKSKKKESLERLVKKTVFLANLVANPHRRKVIPYLI